MGEALAAAIGIALSPFAIIPAVLLLFTVTPIKSALSFASGWFLGVGVVTVAAVLLADAMTLPDSPSREVSWLRVAVGVGLIVLGLEKFIRRGGANADGGIDLVVEKDGTVSLYNGYTEMGQGLLTICQQFASEITGLKARGDVVEPGGRRWGNLQTIVWDRGSGAVEAAADPRVEGAGLLD